MNSKSAISAAFITGIAAIAMALAFGVRPVYAGVTTSTISIVGWLAPDSTHFTNGLMAMIFPLGGVAAFVWIGKQFGVRGDVAVYLVLLGLLLGSVGADLSVGGGAAKAYIPFGFIVTMGILFFLWWWDS